MEAGREITLEVKDDKTNYMFMSRDQNSGRSRSVKYGSSSFERVEEFQYLETNMAHQNSIQEEIKGRLKSENACYHLVQNLLSSRLLSKLLKIKIYTVINFPFVLYGCETWSVTMAEKTKMSVSENRVLMRIFGPRSDEVTREWGKLHNEKLNDPYNSPNIVRVIKSKRM